MRAPRRKLTPYATVAGLAAATLTASVLAAPAAFAATTVTVAADGSGNFTTVQAAINAAPTNGTTTYTINIKAGTYRALVSIPSNKPNISLVGTGASASAVVIVFNNASGTAKPGGGTYGTSGSATVIRGHLIHFCDDLV
jgi:pectinesterase